jgi:hypothetical protein
MSKIKQTPISAFIITAGTRSDKILAATLKAASWVDELILVDKRQILRDSAFLFPKLVNVDILREYNIKYQRTDWSPTVEPTRAFADILCTHDWRICLDDDEILSEGAEYFLRNFVNNDSIPGAPNFDVLMIPIKHWILGRHDPRARYWPEYRPTLYRKGAIQRTDTVHAGAKIVGNIAPSGPDFPVYIDHLSHEDISAWLEKTNRYTDQKDRSGMRAPKDVWEFAFERLQNAQHGPGKDQYLATNDILHALYEIIDGLKRWEETEPSGAEVFDKFCDSVLARP